jgi:hypothetical protein
VKKAAVLIALGFAAAALGACSSGPSVKSYLAKADPLCKQGNDLVAVIAIPADLNGFVDFGNKLADTTTKTVTTLDALKMPSGKKGDGAKAFIAGLKKGAADSKTLGAKAGAADFPGVETMAAAVQADFKDADTKARTYGSVQCGQQQADVAARGAQAAPAAAKKAFIGKLDAICADVNAKLKIIPDPSTLAEVHTYVDKTIGLVVPALAQMKAIAPPSLDKPTLDAYFAENDKEMDLARQASAAAAANQGSKTDDLLNQIDQSGTTANAKADAYGMKDCGSQGQ